MIAPSRAGSDPSGMISQLLHGGVNKAFKLYFGDGPQAVNRHADCNSRDRRLRQGCVHDSVFSKEIEQPLCGPENPSVFPHVLSENKHSWIFLHLLFQGQIDCLDHRQFCHNPRPSVADVPSPVRIDEALQLLLKFGRELMEGKAEYVSWVRRREVFLFMNGLFYFLSGFWTERLVVRLFPKTLFPHVI